MPFYSIDLLLDFLKHTTVFLNEKEMFKPNVLTVATHLDSYTVVYKML